MVAVLIVENDDHVLHSLGAMFSAEGFDVHSTWSAREALRLLESHHFGVVLVGDYLPDLHYLEFMKRITLHASRVPHIILMQTGKLAASEIRRLKVLGIVDVVNKSYLQEIRQAVVTRRNPGVIHFSGSE